MKCVNGNTVPDSYTMDRLQEMLESSDMKIFAVACEALKNTGTPDAYALLKQHIDTKDRYKLRYILSVIFDFDESAELSVYFLDALQSDSRMFPETVLRHLVRRNIWVSDEQILSCFEKNRSWINGYFYQMLIHIAKTPEYTQRLIRLFHTAKNNSIRIAAAECMEYFATQENYMQLFELLANSNIAKIRLEACRIAHKFNRMDLLQRYANDPDGHIRKFVMRGWTAK